MRVNKMRMKDKEKKTGGEGGMSRGREEEEEAGEKVGVVKEGRKETGMKERKVG